MKKRELNLVLFILFSLSLLIINSCGSLAKPYTESTKNFVAHYRSENYSQALSLAHAFVKKSQKRPQDKFLALLERGKVALAYGDYKTAIKDLQRAEGRFLNIEGTISIGENISSLFTDDTSSEYEAEPHEKILISPYLALAYLAKGDFEGARIERNRTITKINQYIESDRSKKHLENPFARYIAALIYEMEGKYDDARIEYTKIAKISKSFRYMKKEAKRFRKRIKRSTDIVVIVDVGLAPQKYQVKWGPMPIPIAGERVWIGFAYAKYRTRSSSVGRCQIVIDNKEMGKTRILYNLEKTILKQYKEKNVISKILARLTAKAAIQIAVKKGLKAASKKKGKLLGFLVDIAAAVSISLEQADLRAWLTLPKNIQFIRINKLTPGKHSIEINYPGGSQIVKINLKEDKLHILYITVPK